MKKETINNLSVSSNDSQLRKFSVNINEFNLLTLGNCINADEILSADENDSKARPPFSEN
jgi:hypothetical protein